MPASWLLLAVFAVQDPIPVVEGQAVRINAVSPDGQLSTAPVFPSLEEALKYDGDVAASNRTHTAPPTEGMVYLGHNTPATILRLHSGVAGDGANQRLIKIRLDGGFLAGREVWTSPRLVRPADQPDPSILSMKSAVSRRMPRTAADEREARRLREGRERWRLDPDFTPHVGDLCYLGVANIDAESGGRLSPIYPARCFSSFDAASEYARRAPEAKKRRVSVAPDCYEPRAATPAIVREIRSVEVVRDGEEASVELIRVELIEGDFYGRLFWTAIGSAQRFKVPREDVRE